MINFTESFSHFNELRLFVVPKKTEEDHHATGGQNVWWPVTCRMHSNLSDKGENLGTWNILSLGKL